MALLPTGLPVGVVEGPVALVSPPTTEVWVTTGGLPVVYPVVPLVVGMGPPVPVPVPTEVTQVLWATEVHELLAASVEVQEALPVPVAEALLVLVHVELASVPVTAGLEDWPVGRMSVTEEESWARTTAVRAERTTE